MSGSDYKSYDRLSDITNVEQRSPLKKKVADETIRSLQLVDKLLGLKDMRKTFKIISILFFSILVSCENDDIGSADEFLVIVESEGDISCGLPVIQFLDNFEKVKAKTSFETLTYNAYKLDDSLKIPGKKLIIKFILTAPEDLRACNTLGIMFPWITITEARSQN